MIKGKLFLVFGMFFILIGAGVLKAQVAQQPIVLNEYGVSNVPPGSADIRGNLSDWVEIYNNHTFSVSLTGYYLSNDRNNLTKWKFPNGFSMAVGTYSVIWLSGSTSSSGFVTVNGVSEVHANFSMEQCKNQWLILSSSTGVVRDSIFVSHTMAGHSRGRMYGAYNSIGGAEWRIFKTPSPGQKNGSIFYKGYAPTPKMVTSSASNYTQSINTGSFIPDQSQMVYFKLQGQTFDTSLSCYHIYYTLDGSYPIPGNLPRTQFYADSATGSSNLTLANTIMIRAIAVPNPTAAACPSPTDILVGFCETNTYFTDPNHQLFDPSFGVVSLAMDTSWFTSGGTTPSTIHVEYYDNKKQVSEGYGIINRPPQEEWLTKQRGLYISIDDRFGFGCNFEGNVFNVEGLGTSSRTVFPTLHLKAGDLESHSQPIAITTSTSFGTAMRDVFVQSLAAKYKLNVNPLHIKPVITFVNGKYYGVYDLREVFDKYYENYYNGQSLDSLDMNYNHFLESSVTYWDNSTSSFGSNFRTNVYDYIINNPMTAKNYSTAMTRLDKTSFMDYMIVNSYAMNSNLWSYNVGFAKGGQASKPGNKWHYYLWNMPSVFNYTIVPLGQNQYSSPLLSPCYVHNGITPINARAYNGHGNMLSLLMGTYQGKNSYGNASFQLEYKNRYQDLLNSALKCDNVLAHFDYIKKLYLKEMKCHEDAGCETNGNFHTAVDQWDTNMTRFRKTLLQRCYVVESNFSKDAKCYGMTGPYPISIDVKPEGSGKVKLNSMVLDTYIWNGNYYATTMSFKAIPANSDYKFHHWEFRNPQSVKDPLSMDSVGVTFSSPEDVIAVFTDKRNNIVASGDGANVPTGFTPNGDGNNDSFRPLGTGEFATEYQMTIFNRWGQEVFRTVDPLNAWDGNYKGQMAETGVYAYIIIYNNMYNESKTVKGNVTLTR